MPPPWLDQLRQVKKTSTGWQAQCPAHDDSSPSLSIAEGTNGRILLKCHAGCETEAVVTAMGLTMKDLFVDQPGQPGYSTSISAYLSDDYIVKTYDYHNDDGNMIFQVVRYALPNGKKDFRQRHPDPAHPGKWVRHIRNIPLTLYHWPQHKDAPLIYLVEGEKDVESLEALGCAATTNPMGAKKWRQEYTDLLAGKTVIILPDNDQTGREHSLLVAEALRDVATVRILSLPIDIPKGDVSDWIQAGGTRVELEALTADILSSPPSTPPSLAPVQRSILAAKPHIPPLSASLACQRPSWETWLDDYAAHSATWAPRAAPAYHKTVGLWVLSTVAARRIVCPMGSREVYPTLFLALISASGIWTKTEAASIGVKMLRRAGCGHLLSPDRTSPQFLLKFMSGIVPDNYGRKAEEEQEHLRASLAFAAQRGWFYEEWGNMLKQMRRADSPQAELNKLLIVLEGGAETFETGTIQRGLERVVKPYLALLGCATPHDLAPFMGEGDAWWHDGFWPRFAFAVPETGATPLRTPRPRAAHSIPGSLIVPLNNWHQRLGIPHVSIEEEREMNGKATGHWQSSAGALPCQALGIVPEVYDAYEAYNDALLLMIESGDIPPDLNAWYVRAHEKALRVAMLLASIHEQDTITMPYWQEGQVMAESWRANMHQLCTTVNEQAPLSQEARLEQRIIRTLADHGPLTRRQIQQYNKNVSSELLNKTLASMVRMEMITEQKHGKTILYLLYQDAYEGYIDEVQ